MTLLSSELKNLGPWKKGENFLCQFQNEQMVRTIVKLVLGPYFDKIQAVLISNLLTDTFEKEKDCF